MTARTDEANKVREILNPSRVELHKAPKWFLDALSELFKKHRSPGERMPPRSMLVEEVVRRINGPRWLDHWGKIGETFVSEPYDFNSGHARSLDLLCEKIGGRWFISSNSSHFPGRTIRVVISKNEENRSEDEK